MFANRYKIFITCLLFVIFFSGLMGQYFYFGRNKVQYNQFDWQILTTSHFEIYYYSEMKDIAEKGAQFAEDAYSELETKFDHAINYKIPLIFYSTHLHFQQTNVTPGFIPEGVGGFFEFLKGRVVIPSDGSLNQFKKVIRHELIHVFMYSKVNRVNYNHNKLTGTNPPLWFAEGLAEHWSSEWDAQAEMVLRDAVLNNYMIPLEDIWTIQGTFAMYKIGQNILDYIEEKYGDDKVLLLMENIWKHEEFQSVFIETIGKSYKEFDNDWLYYLKKKYYPDLKENDFSSKTASTIVTTGYNFKPAFYQQDDKKYVVFSGNRTGYSSIYIRPLEEIASYKSDDAEVLIKGEKSSDFEAFHLFSSKIDVNTKGILVFGSKSGANDALYLYDIKAKKIDHKYYFKDLVGVLSPSWSPDGTKIVFSGLSFSGYKDIYIFNTSDEQLIKLTNDFYDDNDPSWSPDGNYITFSSDRTDSGKSWAYNIFIMNIHSGEISHITYGKHKDAAPVFSPTGNYIAYTSDRNLKLNIYFTELDQQNGPLDEYRLTNFTNGIFDPEWTPDGGLLFSVYEDRRFQIRYLKDIHDEHFFATKLPKPEIRLSSSPWKFENLKLTDEKKIVGYKKKYNLDFIQSQISMYPGYGSAGGAQIAFTDMLGNDQYHVLLYNTANTKNEFLRSFNFVLTKVSLEKRTNFAYGLFRLAGLRYNYDDSYYFEERVGGFVSLHYPFSQFTRLEFTSNYSYSDKEWYGIRQRNAYLTSNYLSFVMDNSLWGPSGPMEGQRVNLTFGTTFDFKNSNVNYYTILADYRRYFRLSLRNAYAVRLLYLRNNGKEARRFYMGGSWDIRGYHLWSIRAQNIMFTSHELRFPFIDLLGIRFPIGGIGFNAIRGALFVDVANIWNEDDGTYNYREDRSLFGSFGAGVRMRLFYFLVLRWDIGKTFTLNSDKWSRFNVAQLTGPLKIDKGLFTQFFFGWDF
jgi:hypothetical protein